MTFKKIHFIINPASGNDEPILSWISDTFQKTSITWEVSVTKRRGDAKRFTKKAIKSRVDAVAVYGGDGTVMEVAQALFTTNIPLAIIPGGTSNVLAKDLGIPQNTQKALTLLTKRKQNIKVIDMGLCNRMPFALRINVGFMADVVKKTTRVTKDQLGQMAYVFTAISEIGKTKESLYEIVVDEKKKKVKGNALVIANTGNVGIQGLSLVPGIDISDGFLDVMVFQTSDIRSLLTWAAHVAAQTKPKGIVRHWKGKRITIKISPKQSIFLDDAPLKTKALKISVVPKALAVVLP